MDALNSLKTRRQEVQILFFSVLFLCCPIYAISGVPVIRSISLQLGANSIEITYDLYNSTEEPVSISLECSDDNTDMFDITPISVSGDVGNDISPGSGKHITWNISEDLPGVAPESIRIRLVADSGTHVLRYIPSSDGAVMVLIPGGTFEMGDGEKGDEPVHTVQVDDFYMDIHEVTNAQYAEFLNATGHTPPIYWDDPRYNAPDQPVIGITWYDAIAYCNWAGKRLPTEAEWERAARAGLVGYKYPWGNELDRSYANFEGTGGLDQWEDTAPICSFLPNDFGLFDMIGNAYEWCHDYYDFDYYRDSPIVNPTGPDSGTARVVRGGSCYDGYYPSYLRSANRFEYLPETNDGIVGFRCVTDISK